MTGRRVVLIVAGLLVVGVGIAFLIIGLDRADKAASVIGALVGLAGLGFSVWVYMKPASLPVNTSKWSHIYVTDSEMVQLGDGNVMEGTLGTDQRRSTGSDPRDEQQGSHESRFDSPHD